MPGKWGGGKPENGCLRLEGELKKTQRAKAMPSFTWMIA